MEKIVLNNVDVNGLKGIINKSLIVNGILNLEISDKEIKSLAVNEDRSLFKDWRMPTTDIYETKEEFDFKKLSLFAGKEFQKQILEYMGNTCTIELVYSDDIIDKIIVKNDIAQFDIEKADMNLTWNEVEDEVKPLIFGFSDDKIASFSLDLVQLEEIRRICKIKTNPTQSVKYVRFFTENGSLFATDHTFKLKLGDSEETVVNADLNKAYLSHLCDEDYRVHICGGEPSNRFVFESIDSNTVCGVMGISELLAGSETIKRMDEDMNFESVL